MGPGTGPRVGARLEYSLPPCLLGSQGSCMLVTRATFPLGELGLRGQRPNSREAQAEDPL